MILFKVNLTGETPGKVTLVLQRVLLGISRDQAQRHNLHHTFSNKYSRSHELITRRKCCISSNFTSL
jgi:hypothetical protein